MIGHYTQASAHSDHAGCSRVYSSGQIRKMRILLAGPCSTAAFRSGLGLSLHGAPSGQIQTPIGPLAIELIARGHSVHVVTLDYNLSEPERFFEHQFAISYLPARSRARSRALDLFAKEIGALSAEYRAISPDIIHAHWTYEYAEAGLRSGLPLLVTAHDSPIDNVFVYRDAYRMFRLVMAMRTLMRVRHLTCVAEYLRPRLRPLGFVKAIDVIPNGVQFFEQKVIKDRNGDSPTCRPPIIVTIGNNSRTKNVPAAIAAFKRIRATVPNAELHLFGDGLDTNFAGNHPGLVPHGSTSHPELLDFLRSKARLLIHPSRLEACPVAILEAMAYGVPCIAGRNSGGVPAIFSSTLLNCLVDIERPEAIASRATQILTVPKEWARLSDLARENIRQNFSIDKIASDYERHYAAITSFRK
jgi:glycosyltransferase involved in cell wall biosynthesis